MSTNETLETLLRLGGLLKDAIARSTEGGKKLDWKTFLESDEYGEIEKDVTDLLSDLTTADLTRAIAEIKLKEKVPYKQKQEGDVDFYFVGSLVYSSLLVFTNFYFWFDLMLSNFKTCKLTR